MSEGQSEASRPDLSQGIALGQLPEGATLLGHVGDNSVLLARRGQEVFAIGATCTHYGGPLAEGLLVDDTVRCPWHHACFSLRTRGGAAGASPQPGRLLAGRAAGRQGRRPGESGGYLEAGPAAGGRYARINPDPRRRRGRQHGSETLRREGYAGGIVMLSADSSVPYDRPNLSKDYLAGNAPEERIPLRSPEFYREHRIELHLGAARGAGRKRQPPLLRRAADRDRSRAGAARCPGRQPAAHPLPALARRQPRHHQEGGDGAARRRDRCKFYRARGRGLAAHAQATLLQGSAGLPARA